MLLKAYISLYRYTQTKSLLVFGMGTECIFCFSLFDHQGKTSNNPDHSVVVIIVVAVTFSLSTLLLTTIMLGGSITLSSIEFDE